MKCKNVKHNLSWTVTGSVSPCNNLTYFPKFSTVDLMHNSEAYKELLQDHKNEQPSRYCQRCWDKEALGLASKRINDNNQHTVYTRLNPNYLKIDAAIGDICNAACRICGPDSSTMWQEQNRKFGDIVDIDRQLSTNEVWTCATNNSDRLLQLDLGGGEPWLNNVAEQIALFDILIETGQAQFVKLRYNTNGSVKPKSMLDKFKYFREVELTLSVDDIDNRFEYNRYPLKWNNVWKNIEHLLDLSRIHSNISITVNYTVSVFTFYYATEFEKWAQSVGITRVNWNILAIPLIYSIKALPVLIKNQLDPTMPFYNLVAQTPQPNWLELFSNLTDKLDKQRMQTFSRTFPELNKLIKASL